MNVFDALAKQFGIEKKINAAVTDNGANMIAALNLSLPAFGAASDDQEEEFLNAVVEAERLSVKVLLASHVCNVVCQLYCKLGH